MFASKSPVSLRADQRADKVDLPCSGERQQVGARALTKCFQSTESIWAEVCLQTRYSHLARFREGVDCVGKWTHLA